MYRIAHVFAHKVRPSFIRTLMKNTNKNIEYNLYFYHDIHQRVNYIDVLQKHPYIHKSINTTFSFFTHKNNLKQSIKKDSLVVISDHHVDILDLHKTFQTFLLAHSIYAFPRDTLFLDTLKKDICYGVIGKYGKELPCEKKFVMHTLPQFDLLSFHKRKETLEELQLPIHSKVLLFINAKKHYIEPMRKILALLKKHFPSHVILMKNKIECFDFSLLPDVHVIPSNRWLYDYLYADVIFCYEEGTSYIESLMCHPNILLYKGDYRKVRTTVEEEHGLLSSFTHETLEEDIHKLKEGYVYTKEYKDRIHAYLKYIVGNVKGHSSDILNQVIKISRNI